MDDRANKVLILGIGNDIQQDVGIPVRLTRDMKDLVPAGDFDFEVNFFLPFLTNCCIVGIRYYF